MNNLGLQSQFSSAPVMGGMGGMNGGGFFSNNQNNNNFQNPPNNNQFGFGVPPPQSQPFVGGNNNFVQNQPTQINVDFTGMKTKKFFKRILLIFFVF
jgi:hypothetical protein